MPKRILIMGLPGSGKTTLAAAIYQRLISCGKNVKWINADKIRTEFNDWDFSEEGRIRQSHRMFTLAENSNADYVICDFVAPLAEMRENFKAHYTVWMDTIREGRYADTNSMFVPPEKFDFRITEKDADKWADVISAHISKHLYE